MVSRVMGLRSVRVLHLCVLLVCLLNVLPAFFSFNLCQTIFRMFLLMEALYYRIYCYGMSFRYCCFADKSNDKKHLVTTFL